MLFTIAMLFVLVPSVIAAPLGNSIVTPDVPLDCGVWPDLPYKSGSVVVGTGEVSCDTAHPNLRVVAGIRDSSGRYWSVERQCYNTDYCSVSASLSYVSGRQWQTDVSGYVGSWNAYYSSYWLSIQ